MNIELAATMRVLSSSGMLGVFIKEQIRLRGSLVTMELSGAFEWRMSEFEADWVRLNGQIGDAICQ